MYTPSFNNFRDRQELISFMQRYSFATIITVENGTPQATHLPFLVTEEDGKIKLRSHFAKVNPQSKQFANTTLVIFTEPHAYISTALYEKKENVPTWNYIAVHAYGNGRLIEELDKKTELLQHTIENYEAGYLQQWESLTEEYKLKMMNGIAAFEIEVTEIQAKKKLSQNRSEKEKDNIINFLSKSGDTNAKQIADYMLKLKDDKTGNQLT